MQKVENALTSANTAASNARGVFIAFVTLTAYIAVTLMETTDEQLFLYQSISLPIISTDVNLKSYYILTPWIYLFAHANLLLILGLTKQKLLIFEIELAGENSENKRFLRSRLQIFIFNQYSSADLPLVLRMMTAFISWLTICFLPPILLFWMILDFIPAQEVSVLWGQRVALIIDCVLAYYFWNYLLRRNTPIAEQQGSRSSSIGHVVFSWFTSSFYIVILYLSVFVALIPLSKWERILMRHWYWEVVLISFILISYCAFKFRTFLIPWIENSIKESRSKYGNSLRIFSVGPHLVLIILVGIFTLISTIGIDRYHIPNLSRCSDINTIGWQDHPVIYGNERNYNEWDQAMDQALERYNPHDGRTVSYWPRVCTPRLTEYFMDTKQHKDPLFPRYIRAAGIVATGGETEIKTINGFNCNTSYDCDRANELYLDQLSGFDASARLFRFAELDGGVLPKIDFSYSQLQGALLSGAVVSDANFSYSTLSSAWVNGANLTGANFYRTEFRNTRLLNVNLTKSYLWRNEFNQASLNGVLISDISGLDFSNASDVDNITLEVDFNVDSWAMTLSNVYCKFHDNPLKFQSDIEIAPYGYVSLSGFYGREYQIQTENLPTIGKLDVDIKRDLGASIIERCNVNLVKEWLAKNQEVFFPSQYLDFKRS